MHVQPFDRLVRAADGLAAIVRELVLIQRGASRYTPTSSSSFDFTDEASMATFLSTARVVVAHGGAGSILEAIGAGKPLVLVPRLKRFGECLDDHQLELVEALAGQGRAVAVVDPTAERLHAAIEKTGQLTGCAAGAGDLQRALRAWLTHRSREPETRGLKFPWVVAGGHDQ
jgi:UDP-N-acetylglucosamine transferase subunit ALG13